LEKKRNKKNKGRVEGQRPDVELFGDPKNDDLGVEGVEG